MTASPEENQYLGTEYKPELFLSCDFLSTLLISMGKFSRVTDQDLDHLPHLLRGYMDFAAKSSLVCAVPLTAMLCSVSLLQTDQYLPPNLLEFVCFQALVQHCKICSGAVVQAHTMRSSLLFPEPLSTWDKTPLAHFFMLLFDGAVNKVHVAAATGTSEILPEEG